jgi:hypothetical protein
MNPVMQLVPEAHYATVWSYFQDLWALNQTWPTAVGDFFPYVGLPFSVRCLWFAVDAC